MKIECFNEPATRTTDAALAVGIYADGTLSAAAAELNEASGGLISRLLESKEASGKAFELTTLYQLPGVAAPLVLLVGCGNRAQFDEAMAYRTAATATRQLSAKPRESVALYFDLGSASLVENAAAGALNGCQGQDLYRAERRRTPPQRIRLATSDTAALQNGQIIGESISLTRRLVNEPPQELYPETFATAAERAAGEARLACEVWDERRLTAERCEALLAVAKGSSRPPRMVTLRHQGAGEAAPWLALVGKGVTFDSGGLSLKTPEGMLSMKCDMAGAATVLGAMRAIGLLGLKCNVVGYMGLVENMPSHNAMKLGDVLRARNGRTIEVHNTDAEGRLVLADVLSVAVDQGAERLIDLATLTGACTVALGRDVAGLLGNDDAWCEQVRRAAIALGEPLWPLPMFDDPRLTNFAELIRSETADIKNVGDGRYGGTITAAKFLQEFVSGKPWAHLDIAGPAFIEKPKPWCDGGASGMFVRTLVEVARGRAAGR